MNNVSRIRRPAGAITYKFEIARDQSFGSIIASGSNTEGINETGFIPTADLPTRVLLYWRAMAFDAANGITSSPSLTQSFTALPPSQAETLGAQLGVVLWDGSQPPGTQGHATMGDNWQVQTLHYLPGNVFFQSPDVEMLRILICSIAASTLTAPRLDPATAIPPRRCGTRRLKRL